MTRSLRLFLALFIFSSSLFAQEVQTSLNLMPVPNRVTMKEGRFRLDSNFTIGITGNVGKRVLPYASRVLQRLDRRTAILVKQGYLDSTACNANASFVIYCGNVAKLELGMDESYKLIVSPTKIELLSATDIGALRGMETFLQLVSQDELGYYVPCIDISDRPRFAWRGLLMDVARHFYPVDVIKRNIDGMAAVKMNVLHLHLSDDQGFRVECKKFPLLHQLGSNGLYYTQAQIKDIIAYADARGIRVVPEFDMPAHTTSWFVGYPKLSAGAAPFKIITGFSGFFSSMDPANKYTYKFLSAFIAEMAKLFPDEYFHIGGDENSGEEWDKNAEIQAFMKKQGFTTNDELQKYFNQQLLKILTRNGKKMMGWDEILQPGLPKDIVIQSWRGMANMVDAAKKGYQTILSNGYYIDLSQSTIFHYMNDPLPDTVNLDEQQTKCILGGEATMWSEITSDETVDSRIWPRTAAIAERLWSPASVKDVDNMYKRLEVISIQLEELGLTHIKNRDMMMRRLIGSDSIEALKTFISAVQPWKGYKRHSKGIDYTTTSPLSRVADVAVPDEAVARRFNNVVEAYLGKPCDSLKNILIAMMEKWRNNDAAMMALIDKTPALKEIEEVSGNLSALADIGLQCLDYLGANHSPEEEWTEETDIMLDKLKQPVPKSEVDIAITPGIESLFDALLKEK
jgi:hexosaminidase